jgi:hypothetical protein
MTEKEEAIKFFEDHAKWLETSWSMTPEGREYKEKFEKYIKILTKEDK